MGQRSDSDKQLKRKAHWEQGCQARANRPRLAAYLRFAQGHRTQWPVEVGGTEIAVLFDVHVCGAGEPVEAQTILLIVDLI